MVDRTQQEQNILDNIIACMNHKKISQKELCGYLGINPQAFTNWKNQNTNSYLKYLTKIAEYFDITVEHLMSRVVISEESLYEDKLLRYFSLCDAEGKLRVIQCAMNEFDRSQKEKTEVEEPITVS